MEHNETYFMHFDVDVAKIYSGWHFVQMPVISLKAAQKSSDVYTTQRPKSDLNLYPVLQLKHPPVSILY